MIERPCGWPYQSMREWVSFLREKGDLHENERPVDLDGDVAACSKLTAGRDGPAILHTDIEGYPGWSIFSDSLTSPRRQAWAYGLSEPSEVALSLPDRLKQAPIKPRVVETGPCKEVKYFGANIDLTDLPLPLTGEFDRPPIITSGVSNVRDPETGWQNSGIRRFQLKGKDRLTVIVLPSMHEGVIFAKYIQRKEPMPTAIVIGADPLYELATLMPAPVNFDEMDHWGMLTGQPLEVVRCETSDLLVPASAEIVIEGVVDPERRQLEGPFSEMPGYYSGLRKCPVVQVTAVTTRKDPVYRYLYAGVEPTETHAVVHGAAEVQLYSELRRHLPEIRDISITAAFGLTMVVSIDKAARKKRRGLVNRVGMLVKALQGGVFCKNLLVVDDDINVRDLKEVIWAFTVRFQPSKDISVVRHTPSIIIDPSEPWAYGGYGETDFAIYDLTEKLEPYDVGYRSGVARPRRSSLERALELMPL